MTLSFVRPEWLWLLLVVPALWLVARWSRRPLSRARWGWVLALRGLLAASLVVALAEPEVRRQVDDLAVVFLVDASASVGARGEQRALDYVHAALESQGAHDQAGVVLFGADAVIEQAPRERLAVNAFESRPSPHQTDIASGLRLGAALLPADRTRRIVLLTDGEQTRGDAAEQALLTRDEDLDLVVVRLEGSDAPEVLLEDLLGPSHAEEGATYELKVVARADQDAAGVVRLYRNEAYLGELPVELEGGRSRVLSFRQAAGDPGLYRYRAVIEVDPTLDGRPENNQVVSTVLVAGRPRVLLVERDPAQGAHLAAALRGEELTVDLVGAGGLPGELGGLRPYQAVILSDIASYKVPLSAQEALESYVRDLGRGLVMIGGDESFGVGGWYQSPVERALPVRTDLTDKTRFPQLGMVLALDKSCSMGGGAGSKLGMAKEAAIRTAELLSDRDYLGVITFDGAASWVTPLAKLDGRRTAVVSDIASIRSGGGTDVYPAVDAAVTALGKTDAAVRHIVLISDGITGGGDYERLIGGAYRDDHVTLTAVATGADADTTTMRSFAGWGSGNYYLVTDKAQIPAIFTREAMLATRSFLVEEPFVPALSMPSDLTRGLSGFPELGGYVATEAKARSVVAMVVPGEEHTDPLLVHGRYGLGRSVAFTSDAKPRWAKDWVGTSSYVQLWRQVGRWVADDGGDEGLDATAEIREGELRLTVDALTSTGGFRNFLQGEARVVAPDLTVHHVPLAQVGPGRYQASLPVDQDGSWIAGLQLTDGGEIVGQAVAEAVQPYSPEFRRKGAGRALLQELERVGRAGAFEDPQLAFARPEVPREVPRAIWPLFMAAAAVLLVLDVAARRLDFGGDPRAAAVRLESSAGGAGGRWARLRPVPGPRSAGGPAVDEAPPAESGPPPIDVPPDSYAGRLLAARKSARKKM